MASATYLEDTCKSALNRVASGDPLPYDWTLNPYRGCTHSGHYCFGRAYHSYLGLGIGADFERRIVMKTNVASVLQAELRSPRWERAPVAMGTATDPYQPCEGRYGLTRTVIATLSESRTPLSMLTKSTLVIRNLDLFVELDERAGATLAMSIGTLDDSVRQLVEPETPPPASRLEVLRRFSSAGIRTGVLIAFASIAAAIFFFVGKPVQRLERRRQEELAASVTNCPHCVGEIPVAATRCPFCTSEL